MPLLLLFELKAWTLWLGLLALGLGVAALGSGQSGYWWIAGASVVGSVACWIMSRSG